MLADHITARHPAVSQKCLRADQHAGRAETALQRIAPLECLLEVGNDAGIRNAFDGLHLGAVALHGKDEAAAHDLVVDHHGAGAAHALLAADMAAGQPQILAQEIDQRLAGLDALAHVLAIDAHADVEVAFGHDPIRVSAALTAS